MKILMKILHSATDPRAHEEFLAWVKAHPNDLYLNERSAGEMMFHRGRCWHIEFSQPVDLTKARKIVGGDRAVLEEWARSQGATVTECSDCVKRRAPTARVLEE